MVLTPVQIVLLVGALLAAIAGFLQGYWYTSPERERKLNLLCLSVALIICAVLAPTVFK